MESLDEMKQRHYLESRKFEIDCPHTDVVVEDSCEGFRRRSITLRCGRCRLNLLGYTVDGDMSYMSYVRACVNGHPSTRDEVHHEK